MSLEADRAALASKRAALRRTCADMDALIIRAQHQVTQLRRLRVVAGEDAGMPPRRAGHAARIDGSD